MKKLKLILAICCCVGLLILVDSIPSNQTIAVNQTLSYFKEHAIQFANSADYLEQIIGEINTNDAQSVVKVKEALIQSRLHYKHIEFFLNYFFGTIALSYNAPAAIEVEEPSMEYREPTGFQVIEAMLFEEDPAAQKKEMLDQANLINSSARDLNSLYPPGSSAPGTRERWRGKAAARPYSQSYRFLRSVLNMAVLDEAIPNPCQIPRAGTDRPKERPVASPVEVAALIDAVTPQYRAAIAFAAWCGLRRGRDLRPPGSATSTSTTPRCASTSTSNCSRGSTPVREATQERRRDPDCLHPHMSFRWCDNTPSGGPVRSCSSSVRMAAA